MGPFFESCHAFVFYKRTLFPLAIASESVVNGRQFDRAADRLELSCLSLGMILQTRSREWARLIPKSAVTVGIRAENIIVKAEATMDKAGMPAPNQAVYTVKHIHQRRNGLILLLQPANGAGEYLLEADIATDSSGQVSAFSVGQKVVISLQAEQFLLFVG